MKLVGMWLNFLIIILWFWGFDYLVMFIWKLNFNGFFKYCYMDKFFLVNKLELWFWLVIG